MSGYEYSNARLRAMKSRLLRKADLETLVRAKNLQEAVNLLLKTAYRTAVEAALARVSELECIREALNRDFVNTVWKIQTFFGDEHKEWIRIILHRYDIHNLKAVLRGLSTHTSAAEIERSIVLVGELPGDILAEMARSPHPRAAIDLLASLRLSYAQPLLVLRGEKPGAGPLEMELALEHWRFESAFRSLRRVPDDSRLLLEAMRMEADLLNLFTVLRLVVSPRERQSLQRLSNGQLRPLMVRPGRLSLEALERLASQRSLKALAEELRGTIYAAPVQEGLQAYEQSGRAGSIERALRHYQNSWLASLIYKDPLGIGVLLGYLALRAVETSNILWTAQGIQLRMSHQAIWSEVELVT